MSDSEDADSKTEEPTEKKIGDALEKGETAVSKEVANFAAFLALFLGLAFIVRSSSAHLTGSLALLLENAGTIGLGSNVDLWKILGFIVGETANFLGPLLGLIAGFGLAASFAQGAPRLVIDRIMPDLGRVSPLKGWKRLFGMTGLIELLKSVVKIVILAGALAFSLMIDRTALTNSMRTDPRLTPELIMTIVLHLTSIVCLVGGLLAGADFFWTRFKWRRDLRMSRHELKEEMKQAEGGAMVKARMRSLAQSRARKRMMNAVPRATLVIANPTHYAIALRYVREEGGAPLVLAKGTDLIALKIREVAEANQIPVFEKKELVRAMYDLVEIDQMIPPEFFRPIAELIHFLSSHGGARGGSAGLPGA
jgi:flagellar biosynthesis protein FlhB